MRSYRFPAMGTEVHVLLPLDQGSAITPVRELFADWEARLSRFLAESELSQLNAHAGEPVVVSRLLFDVVQAGIEGARATDGAFDPTLLRQLVRVGYARSFDLMSDSIEPAAQSPEEGGSWRQVVLDPRMRVITLPARCALDLGGIAKGMAVDAALELLRGRGVRAALVSAGGDLAVRGLPNGASAWAVLAGDQPESQIVPLVRGALATSGVGRRSWLQEGIPRHHLIDPRNGEPAWTSLREVTVAASSCREAEVAATASFVLGPRQGADLLSRYRLAGRLTHDDGTQVTVGPWPSLLPDAA
jgi:thiamine biosynthesis lipoprotein